MIKLKEREVVIVGGGLTAGLLARRLVPAGHDVLVLERGPARTGGPEAELPSQRDELRWGTYRGMSQRENLETITLRHSVKEQSLPMRRITSFLPGFGVGGAISHWNGLTWRYQTTDYVLRTHLESRYGKSAIAGLIHTGLGPEVRRPRTLLHAVREPVRRLRRSRQYQGRKATHG